MKKNITFPNLLQKIVSEEELAIIQTAIGYKDTARKLELILGIVALPVLMVFMTIIGKLRSSNWTTSGDSSVKDSIFEFFYSQGISANLIGYTKLYHEYVPKGRLYTFGPLMEFVDNKIIRPMHGMPGLFGQNIDRALNGYLYAHAISYLIMPTAYLMGIGYGSSFVAEMYNDFSYGGVFVGSIVYGAILYLFYHMLRNSNYVVVIFTLMMTRSILFAPRGAALSFIVSSFSMPKIFAVIVIVIGAKALHMMIGEKRFPSLPRVTWK
ncbi:O-antigen polysaccharide polymerase Wzy [Priestia flexa]|uniref:O-antigen polysaccharide polymerase Wzy n=1 Tax=Priestia flexa TaxID=86664 RepID=UPI0010FBE776|nr:O-antigen polysaccharide polymerase Wzy [Priestia flexa]QCS52391.1 O-antigen polysaccharide polymerase Wzy [Priestia flexa]